MNLYMSCILSVLLYFHFRDEHMLKKFVFGVTIFVHGSIFVFRQCPFCRSADCYRELPASAWEPQPPAQLKGSTSNLALIFQPNEQTSQGPFSSVSTPKFATNIRWKALDEIYKIYMLLHRSDLNISRKFSSNFFAFFGEI